MKIFLGFLAGIMLYGSVFAQDFSSAVTPKDSLIKLSEFLEYDFLPFYEKCERPKIGLALSGGSALGFAHIGVLEMLDSLKLPVDFVAGTSMGAIVGGLYSIGYSTEELCDLAINTNWDEIFTDTPRREQMPFFEKQNQGRYQLELKLKGFTPSVPSGLIQGQKIKLKLASLTNGYEGVESFLDFPIPFSCVAADLISAEQVVLSKGSLSASLRASMSIPTVFSPVEIDDNLLIDGGIVNNFPTDVVKDMGADFIIGLNLTYPKKTAKDYSSFLDVLDRTTDLPRINKLKQNINVANLYITEYTAGLSLMDFDDEKVPVIIDRGRVAAHENFNKLLAVKKCLEIIERKFNSDRITLHASAVVSEYPIDIDRIKQYLGIKDKGEFDKEYFIARLEELNNNGDYDSVFYSIKQVGKNEVDVRVDIKLNQPPLIHSLLISGNEMHSFAFIFNNLGFRPGERFDREIIEEKITKLYALGYFDLIYYEIGEVREKSIDLKIIVKEHPIRKLFIGMRYNDYHQLVGAISIQAASLFFPGLRSDTELQFAGLQKFSTKVYRSFHRLDIQAYPYLRVNYKNIPWSIFDRNGDKFADYKDRSWLIAAGIGIPIGNFWLFEAEYAREYMNITSDIESTNLVTNFPAWKDNLVQVNMRIDLDLLDDILFPRNGLKIDLEAEIASKRLDSDLGYTRFSAIADWYNTILGKHTFRLFGAYMIQWRDTPQYKWHSVGGPHDLVGFDYNQVYGSKFVLGRFEYRYEYRKDIFLKGIINSVFDYNLGEASDPIVGKPLIGYGVGVEFASLLGPLQVLFARGDKTPYAPGEQRSFIYFTAGYKF